MLVAGCGAKPSKPSAADPGSPLSASELARLTDFHAWKVRIPQTQEPVKDIRLVIVKRDGTVLPKFHTGTNLGESCSSILLGFRVEGDTFAGHFFTQDCKGGGIGWNLSFADVFGQSNPAWVAPGTALWNGNRAQLAEAMKEGDMCGSILAIELLK